MRLLGIVTSLVVLLTLVSCTALEPVQQPPEQVKQPPKQVRPSGPPPPSTRPTYNLSGYPRATKEGYIDGCETAKKTPYGYKDSDRYTHDGQYRMGWDDGFSLCRGKQ